MSSRPLHPAALWHKLRHGLRVLRDRGRSDRDLAAEVEHYLAEAIAEHIARGLSPEAAERRAQKELGSGFRIREEVRGYGWENHVESLLLDLRYAVRGLRARTGTTSVIVGTLALGIGATIAIWSAASPVLFESLPYPEPQRIVALWDVGEGGSRLDLTYGTYREIVERSRSFDHLALYKPWQPTWQGSSEPLPLHGQRVSASFFDVLGIKPALGTTFDADVDRPDGAEVVVLSHDLWRDRFGSDVSILGRYLALDDTEGSGRYLVVGVMPPSFENVVAPEAQLWAPLQYDLSQGRAWGHHLRAVGRLRPEVSVELAQQELAEIAAVPLAEHPRPAWASLGEGLKLYPLRDDFAHEVRPALVALLCAVALVLGIACLNVANLLLARGAERGPELMLRTALGAGRGRVVRQLLTESLVLAVLGGALGLVVAAIFLRALVDLAPADLPRLGTVSLDPQVFLLACALTWSTGALCGLFPALRVAGSQAPPASILSPRGASGGQHRGRALLVVAEVAIAVVLLIASGLLLRSLHGVLGVDPGFSPSNRLTMKLPRVGDALQDDDAVRRRREEILEAVRGAPGVAEAALTSQLPLSGDNDAYGVFFEPEVPGDSRKVPSAFRYAVSPAYFGAMGIPLSGGRLLSDRDREGAPRVAVVSESFVARRLPGVDPLGYRVRIGGSGPLYSIVGVVGDVRQLSLALAGADAVYTADAQWRFADSAMSLVVRSEVEGRSPEDDAVTALTASIRRAVWSVDPRQPIVGVATMEQLVKTSAAERNFVLVIFEAFALVALLLAALGVYGVLSARVAERRPEISIRLVLGATPSGIVALVVRYGLGLAGTGAVLGWLCALASTRALSSMLYEISASDPLTHLSMVSLLLGVALLASCIPAWRAACVDPARTLAG